MMSLQEKPKSLYAAYVWEREKAYTIERPYGFAMYKFMPAYVYLVDIYVVPSERKNGRGAELEAAVIEDAQSHDYTSIVGSVDEQAETAEYMKVVMKKRGYKEYGRDGSLIYYKKDI